MSANITIKEGGNGKLFPQIKKLLIHNSGGGTSLWVPEEERTLVEKTATVNAVYNSEEDDHAFGYSKFTANVPKKDKVVGKDPDGDDCEVTRDPNGNLTETKLPHHIAITTNPTKTEYENGETIVMTGSVIKAYKKNGDLWEGEGYTGGVIPLSEITINPTTAQSGGAGSGSITHKGVPMYGVKIDRYIRYGDGSKMAYVSTQYVNVSAPYYKFLLDNEPNIIYFTKYHGDVYAMSLVGACKGYVSTNSEGTAWYGYSPVFKMSYPAPQFYSAYDVVNSIPVPTSPIDPTGIDFSDMGAQIKVMWDRPKDDKTLTTSFNIRVSYPTL